ncbi:MAG: DUF4442 domain-containing protein [Bacteroidota bacterium]
MSFDNNLQRQLSQLEQLPEEQRRPMLNQALGAVVPLVGTAGLDFELMSEEKVIVHLQNDQKVQNHIKQIHAAATVLLAESASGMVVGMNVPDDKIPLMKTLSSKFIKRSEGTQTATAILSPEQIQRIRSTEKGEVNVPTTVVDSTGEEVIIAEMIWAWIPKK